MSERELLEAAYLDGVEAHKAHPPRLRRDRDGIYHCAACNPGNRWERSVNCLLFTRFGVARRGRRLALLFQHLGWHR
ncbi:hypothetical protein DT019_02980 [Streptomyces sp. SDr-06]|uniref:hypothetical protein n=1 Tax=Streptomyces sp. SDr-06 TaxID=2267702 RepID=UPI000DEBC504|nr:hypothetical protein [Streptomyces sp. SDr-06]RCH70467.1 hypothetical protein DT019_02980 [Streptomyces sp. SDr-06]